MVCRCFYFFFGRINQAPERFREGEVIRIDDVGIRKGGEVGNS